MNENFYSLFAARLAEERKRLRLSQSEAGKSCGVSREMWGKYERGLATMGTDVLALFAAQGADVLYVLTGERSGAAPALSREEVELLDNYRHCPPDARKIVQAASAAGAQPTRVTTKRKAG